MARPFVVRSALLGAALVSAPLVAHGQETGSDVQMPAPRIIVASSTLALGAAPMPTAQAFAAAVQATVTRSLVNPRGEAQVRAQLGDFRTSILIKAGVLTFGRSAQPSRITTSQADSKRPAWSSRPIVFVSETSLAAAARR